MIFRKKAIILASIAGSLLLLYVCGEIFSPSRRMASTSGARFFPGFSAEKAAAIEISGKDSKVSLLKSGAWAVSVGGGRYPAAESKIASLLQEIASLQIGTLVTRNAQSASELGFGTAEEVSLVVRGAGGEALCELASGKSGPAGRGRYIRAGKSADVYLTGDSLSSYLTAETRYWENLKVFPQELKAEDIVA
jgi:hypothetical protein